MTTRLKNQSAREMHIERHGLNRRQFLNRVGGGLVVLFVTDTRSTAAPRSPDPEGEMTAPPAFNAYLRIGEDGRVTCYTGKIEMGQGVISSLPQMIAEELDVLLDSVDMVMGDTDRCPFDQGTWGSLTTRVFGPELQAAGAAARSVLLDMAAEQLGVTKSRLDVADGIVYDTAHPDTKISYGDLTKGEQILKDVNELPKIKTRGSHKIVGSSVYRRDSREKVTGMAKYAGDIRLPGMLYARIVRPPAHGATLMEVDLSLARQQEGVEVVVDGDLIAVLHAQRDMADRALMKVFPRWSLPEVSVDTESIFDYLLASAPEGDIVDEGGDISAGQQSAATVVEATYLDGYVAHAPIEPHTAVAQFEDGRMTVWASTQNPFGVKGQVARELAMEEENVRVITPFVGGGFGGKSSNGQAIEAARLAKASGKPVHVAWSREEEFFFDSFRPAAVVKIRSGLSDTGKPIMWDYGVYFAGERGCRHLLEIPNYRTTAYNRGWVARDVHPFATGPWRGPGVSTNTFARESHFDAMAVAAGKDPIDFRLENLKNKKLASTLRSAAEKFGWTPQAGPSGRGYGVACAEDSETFVATIVALTVDKNTGQVNVDRVVAAQDMGLCVNPEGATIQMEGCIMMGLGYALSETIKFRGGQIQTLNFDSYQLPLFSWLPDIETIIVDSGDPKPRGGGEPAVVTMGAAIANAIFDATGARLFRMPMTPERIKDAIAALG